MARILFAAARRPDQAGRVGFAAGDVVSTGDLARFIASLRRPPARTIPVPRLAVRIAAIVETVRQALLGKTLPFNQDKAREMLQPDWLCDSGPFLRDLGVGRLKPWQEGITETCRWYVSQGWLPACFADA